MWPSGGVLAWHAQSPGLNSQHDIITGHGGACLSFQHLGAETRRSEAGGQSIRRNLRSAATQLKHMAEQETLK